MSSERPKFPQFAAASVALLGMLMILIAAVYGAQSDLLETFPVLVAASLFSGLAALLVLPTKIRLNVPLVCLVGLAAAFFAWRAQDSLIRIYAWSDLSLVWLAVIGWGLGCLVGRGRLFAHFLVLALMLLVLGNSLALLQQSKEAGWNLFGFGHPNPEQFTGLFWHRNYFGSFCAISAWVLCGFAFWSDYRNSLRLLIGGFAILALGGVVVSESRGALIASAAGGSVFFAASMLLRRTLNLKFGRVWGWITALAAVAMVLGIVFGAVHTLQQRNSGQNLDQALDSNGRTEILWLAVKVGQDAPLVGHGARSFEYEAIPRWDQSSLWTGSGNINFVHNEYGQLFADYGLIGCLLVVGLILVHLCLGFWNLIHLSGRDIVGGVRSLWPALLTGGLGALVAVSVQANFSFVWHLPVLVLLTGVVGGGLGAAASFSSYEGKRIWAPRVGICLLLLSASVGLAWMSQRIYPAYAWEGVSTDLSLSQAEWLRGSVARLPDWRRQKELAELEKAILRAAKTADEAELARLRNRAIDDYHIAYLMHPKEPGLRLAMADLLSEAGRFDEAEEHFQWVLANAEQRQFWFNQHWIYGIHLYRWATVLYEAREHRLALAKMRQAREEFDHKRMWNNLQWREQRQNSDRFIDYMEKEIIPYLDPPEQ